MFYNLRLTFEFCIQKSKIFADKYHISIKDFFHKWFYHIFRLM